MNTSCIPLSSVCSWSVQAKDQLKVKTFDIVVDIVWSTVSMVITSNFVGFSTTPECSTLTSGPFSFGKV